MNRMNHTKRLLFILPLLLAAPLCAQEKPTADGLYLSTLEDKPPCRGFKIRTTQGDFSDALCGYSDAAWAKLTLAERKNLMHARAANFVATVKAQSSAPKVEPTKEELQARKAELLKQIEAVDAQIAAADAKPVEPVEGEVKP